MSRIVQHDLADYHLFATEVVLAQEVLLRFPIPQSGRVKRLAAVSHGTGLDGTVQIRFFVGKSFAAGAAGLLSDGVVAQMTLLATDFSGTVHVIEFDPPSVASPYQFVREATDDENGLLPLTSSVFTANANPATSTPETYTFVLTVGR